MNDDDECKGLAQYIRTAARPLADDIRDLYTAAKALENGDVAIIAVVDRLNKSDLDRDALILVAAFMARRLSNQQMSLTGNPMYGVPIYN